MKDRLGLEQLPQTLVLQSRLSLHGDGKRSLSPNGADDDPMLIEVLDEMAADEMKAEEEVLAEMEAEEGEEEDGQCRRRQCGQCH